MSKLRTWAAIDLFVLAAIYVIALLAFLGNSGEIPDSVRRLTAGLSPGQASALASAVLVAGAGFHLVFAALFAGLAVLILRGVSWARRAGFVILVLGIVLTLLDTLPGPFPMSLNVPAVLPDQRSIIVSVEAVSVLLQLVALGLLLKRDPGNRESLR